MNFKDLIDKRLIEKYDVPQEEINSIVESSHSDLKTAKELLRSDICWAFNIAYNAVLETGIALMYVYGFRPIGEAKHVSVILFLRKVLGNKFKDDLDRFNQMRRKRNKAVYGIVRNITEYEAKDSVNFASNLASEIQGYINKKHNVNNIAQ